MSDLVTFLRARLDEDEKAARAAGDEHTHWYLNADDNLFEEPGSPIAIGPWGGGIDAEGEHIARHDPARVLAEVEAKRLRIETYELAVARQRAEWGDYSAWLDGGRGEPSMALDGPDPKLIPGLELALKQDALPYASHPKYDESWRP